eukprot:CAMPEP_0116558888 /NCGR_PEP_ID=MMETSP0397-20121206/10075_1 /TAXON_ID=216820 /ORGANISM="Cyclophora tenuis, Strain ECT3854" /LENGTH=551 /DNA_ID=CAMNT_0004084565 /DNA_START=318 /DNA_END=1970 /DNA_ORIENTATION=-
MQNITHSLHLPIYTSPMGNTNHDETTAASGYQLLFTSAAALLFIHEIWLLYNKYRNTSSNKASNAPVTPPHVWSFIPHIGSALELRKKTILDFIHTHADTLKSPIFTATIMGKKCVFMADSRMVPMVFSSRNDALDSNALQIHVLTKVLGYKQQDAVDIMTGTVLPTSQGHYNKHILARPALQIMIPQVQEYVNNEPHHNALAGGVVGWKQQGLYDMVQMHIFVASAAALLSPTVAKREYISVYRDLDEGFPYAFANMPRRFLPKFAASVEKLMELTGTKEFKEQGSNFIKVRHELGLSEDALNRSNGGFLWASVGNSIPAIFWVLYYILVKCIQEEVDRIFESLPQGQSIFDLQHLDDMVQLGSAFQEACRLQFGGFAVRDVTKDFVYEPKIRDNNGTSKCKSSTKYLIRKGTRVMGYAGVLHYDEAVFPNATEFQFDRFAPETDGKKAQFYDRNGKALMTPVMAFGGGSHMCPGRKFIGYENKAYVALLLRRFELRLTTKEVSVGIPGPKKINQGTGMNNPDREVYIEMRPRVLEADRALEGVNGMKEE